MENKIYKGAVANDKTGTPARIAADIININFQLLDENKLDKGNYTGTAEDLNIEIQNLKNPDIVLKNVTPTIDGLNISAPADSFEWRINQVVFDNTPALAKTLTAASDGFYRKDALLGTNTNTYLIIEGVEGDESVTPPTVFPLGTILLGVIDVFGATVGGFSVNGTSRVFIYGNGGETDYLEVDGLGTSIYIMNALSLTGLTIPSQNLQFGKDYYLRNNTSNNILLKSATGTNNIRFCFPQGNLDVPPQNTVHVKFVSTNEFGGLGYFILIGIDYKYKADKTYVDSQDLLKEDKDQKGIAGGYVPLDEDVKIASQYLNLINDLSTGGTTNILSAEMGKVLQAQIIATENLVNTKEPVFTKNTAFNKNFGNSANTVVEGNDTRLVQSFAKKVNAISVTGDTNKTITITREDGTILTASFLDNNTPQAPDDVINTLNFNPNNNGILYAVTSKGEIISVSLDGRYSLLGHIHSIAEITGLSASLAEKAVATNVYTKTEIGDPETDFVAVFVANLT